MPLVTVDNLGRSGLIKDVFNQDTPPEAWTALRNARMGSFGAEKFLGHSSTLGTGSAGWGQAPIWLFYVPLSTGTGFWVACGTTAVKVRLASSPFTETDITRAAGAYLAGESSKWNGDVFGGLLIANNTVDEPQAWQAVASATKLVNLSSIGTGPWPSTYRCGVMKGFGRFLVALNITKSATAFPQLVKWSHPADPGAFPTSWDPTDTTKDAGEFPLQDAVGPLVDQLVLRDQNILYTTDQVWAMRYVGGGDIMGFSPLFHEQGALATHCVAGFKKAAEFHAVLGGDDVYVHNGQSPESIISPAMRRWFFQQIDSTFYSRSFVVANPIYSEIWVCIPENGASQPTLALVWNWDTGAIGFRDLLKESSIDTRTTTATQGTPCITIGKIEDISAETWDSDTATWDSDTTVWDARNSNPATNRLLMADRSAGKRTFLLDNTAQFDGTDFQWSLERYGLSVVGHDRQGNPKSDQDVMKLVTEIWPRFDMQEGETVTINVATQDRPEDPPVWSDDYTYTTGSTLMVPVYHEARFLGVKFSYTGQVPGRLLGYGLGLTFGGHF